MFNELAEMAKMGDEKALAEVIERLQPLIKASVRRYYNKINEYDDLLQDGNIKILECIRDYDLGRGVYFLGYVKVQLKYLYLDKHKQKIHQSLNQTTVDGETEMIDLLESKDKGILETILEQEMNTELGKALDILTNRQREVVLLYYNERLSISDIGSKLGIRYRTVINTKVKALEKMRGNIK